MLRGVGTDLQICNSFIYNQHTLIFMANIFRLRPGLSEQNHVRIRKELRDRIDGCFEPGCWTLKDKDDTGQLYLTKEMVETDDGQGRYVQIRRYLFLTTWYTLPDRRKLFVCCDHTRCQNPTHTTYKGFKPPYGRVTELISTGWITEEKARDYYNGRKNERHGNY